MEPFFKPIAFDKAPIGHGTAAELTRWLEDYTQAAFPQLSVEYWASNEWGRRPTDIAPVTLIQTDFVEARTGRTIFDARSVACWVNVGNSEGRLIHVGLLDKDHGVHRLTWIKTFASEEDCWKLARAISVALENYVTAGIVPAITEMYRALKDHQIISFSGSLRNPGCMELTLSRERFDLAKQGGEVIFTRSFDPAWPALNANDFMIDCWHLLKAHEIDFKFEDLCER